MKWHVLAVAIRVYVKDMDAGEKERRLDDADSNLTCRASWLGNFQAFIPG